MLDWNADVRPVLVAVYTAMKESPTGAPAHMGPVVGSAEVNRTLGRDDPDARTDQALYALSKAGYLGDDAYGMADGKWTLVTLSEKGLIEVAGWPATPGVDYGAKLLDLLDERIEHSADADERGRLSRFREAVTDVGTGVVTGVLTDLAKRGI